MHTKTVSLKRGGGRGTSQRASVAAAPAPIALIPLLLQVVHDSHLGTGLVEAAYAPRSKSRKVENCFSNACQDGQADTAPSRGTSKLACVAAAPPPLLLLPVSLQVALGYALELDCRKPKLGIQTLCTSLKN
jgi:hypothetical protein